MPLHQTPQAAESRYASVSPNGNLICKFQYNPTLIKKMKDTGYATWHPKERVWTLAPSFESIDFVLSNGFYLDETEREAMQELIEYLSKEDDLDEKRLALAHATEAPVIPEIQAKLTFNAQFKPYAYQWVPVNYAMINNGSLLILDEMGVGKSISGILCTMHPDNGGKPTLLVCPANGIYNFKDEIEKFFGFKCFVVTKPLTKLIPGVQFYLVSYQKLRDVKNFDFQFIFDEVQMIKNPKSIRTKEAHRLVRDADTVIGMTGTPTPNQAIEAYTQLCLVRPGFMSYIGFAKKHCNLEMTPFGMRTGGVKDADELNHLIYSKFGVRRLLTQPGIQDQMPELTRQKYEIDNVKVISDSVMGMYSENAMLKALNPAFIDFVKTTLESSEKVLIFARHQVMLQALKDLFKELKLKYAYIDGATSKPKRFEQAQIFNEDPDCKGILLSIEAANSALNLQAGHTIIFAEMFWSPGVLQQCEARAQRTGQKNAVLALYPIFSNFERILFQMLLKKQTTIKRVLGFGKDRVTDATDDESVFKALAKEFNLPLVGKKKVS